MKLAAYFTRCAMRMLADKSALVAIIACRLPKILYATWDGGIPDADKFLSTMPRRDGVFAGVRRAL